MCSREAILVGRTRRAELKERRGLSAERKAEAIEAFVASGKSIVEVAQEFRLREQTLRQWIQEAAGEVAGGNVAGPAPDADSRRCTEPDISSPEYRAQVVAWFLSSGKTIAEVAFTLSLPESTVREWLWYASPEEVPDHTPVPEWTTEAANKPDGSGFVPEVVESTFGNEEVASESATIDAELAAQSEIMAARAEAAEALARVEAKALKAEKALARAERKAAKAEACAKAAAEAETAARAETAAAYAVGVEAMVRAELAAAEAVAQIEAAAATAVSEAEAAARDEVAAVYAEAVEAVIRAEVSADERVAREKAAAAQAIAHAEAVAVEARSAADAEVEARKAAEAATREEVAAAYAVAVEAMVRAEISAAERVAAAEAATAQAVAGSQPDTAGAKEVLAEAAFAQAPLVTTRTSAEPPVATATREMPSVPPYQIAARAQLDESAGGPEAEARAEIAQLVSRLTPVEVWVHMAGRTVAEARKAALDELGVNEADAEIQVLSKGSLLLPHGARVRARVTSGLQSHE